MPLRLSGIRNMSLKNPNPKNTIATLTYPLRCHYGPLKSIPEQYTLIVHIVFGYRPKCPCGQRVTAEGRQPNPFPIPISASCDAPPPPLRLVLPPPLRPAAHPHRLISPVSGASSPTHAALFPPPAPPYFCHPRCLSKPAAALPPPGTIPPPPPLLGTIPPPPSTPYSWFHFSATNRPISLILPPSFASLPPLPSWRMNSPSKSFASSSSGNGDGRDLPIMKCPRCDVPVIKLVSKPTAKNPNSVFYKSPNNNQYDNRCKFYNWEKEYEHYVALLGLQRYEPKDQYIELMSDLKLQNGRMLDLLYAMDKKNSEIVTVLRMQNTMVVGLCVVLGVVCAMCMFVIVFAMS